MKTYEDDVLRCEGYRKDSWRRWTELVWMGIIFQNITSYCAVQMLLDGHHALSLAFSVLSLLGVAMAVYADKRRTKFQSDWTVIIEEWKNPY